MSFTIQAQHRVSVPCTLAIRRPRCANSFQGALASTPRLSPARKSNTVTRARSDNTDKPWSVDRALGAAVPAIAYATLIFYVAKFAPDQTPLRDQYFLEKLVGLGVDDGVPMNPVFFSLFNLMGIYPAIYSCLMIPSARSTLVPVWPFVSCSFAVGAFGIFPYLIFWDLQDNSFKSPPDPTELTSGWGKYGMQAIESPILPAVLLVATVGLLYNAFASGLVSWDAYFRLFDESKFVHVTSLDFCAFSALAPLFLWNDAEKRGVGWAAPLAAFPMIGPLIYLIIRPRASKP